MASNSFGKIFRITTWGESHGKAIGVVIDGCPAGVPLTNSEINNALKQRAPGTTPYTSPRAEPDLGEIYSGVFEGKTTGAPISIIIFNKDQDPSQYEPIKNLLRPGHANYTYLEKYGCFDYRGGGRASARETACRVAAGAVAEKVLTSFGIKVFAYLKSVADVTCPDFTATEFLDKISASPIFCPHQETEKQIMAAIEEAKQQGDSLGGVVELVGLSLPVGLGDPVYEKLEANLAKGMLSIPATKGFEIGTGFRGSKMRGSIHNDHFSAEPGPVTTTNHAGGTLGGLSTGMPLIVKVAFKPTSSIKKPQPTIDQEGSAQPFVLPEGSRHDPCVAIRGVPVVRAMGALVLVDSLLSNRCAKIS